MLTIPRHWRIIAPLLMAGHLGRSAGGHLLRTSSGHLARCDDSEIVCCDDDPPLSVTFAGATGCASPLNGSFALSFSSGCLYSYFEDLTIPESPCGTSACYVQTVSGRSRWWHPFRIQIFAYPSATDQSIQVEARILMNPRYISGGACIGEYVEGLANQECVFERSTCKSGAFTRTYSYSQPAWGSPGNPTSCAVAF